MRTFETILVDVDEAVATLTLNRPDRMNGMTPDMVREVHEALTSLAGAADVRVVVLTGAGRAFCPGADLRHSVDDVDGADGELEPWCYRAAVLLHEMPQVTVAAVNGACAGAGLSWASACDLRFAADAARFNTAFLGVAVAGDMGGPWTLSRIVGAGKARELYLLPDKFDAAEALRIGLVSRVFPSASFLDDVGALVARLARTAPHALRTVKDNFLAAERTTFTDFVDLETERHRHLVRSPEADEAFRAFLEKREPRFGR